MRLSQLAERHRKACHILGCALTLGDDAEVWAGLSFVLRSRLTPLERTLLLGAMLSTLDAEDVSFVLETMTAGHSAALPIPVLEDVESSARWWADLATQEELAAWLAACFVRLSRRDQLAFLAEAGGRSAA
jgi:hypothetical protein